MKLIQRCLFKTSDIAEVVGVDSLFEYEYMGAAEYEFGSLFASLRRIVADMELYAISDTRLRFHNGDALMVYCAADDTSVVCNDIAQVASRSVRVKEGSRLPEPLAGDRPRFYRTEAWWDIDDDWIAFRGASRSPLIEAAVRAVATKWAAKPAA